MIRMQKLTIGIRPATRMFRMVSVGGVAIDAVLRARDNDFLPKDYYTQVTTGADHNGYQLANPENGNTLKLDRDNVVFIKDNFDSDQPIDMKTAVLEFMLIWSEIKKRVPLKCYA